MAGIYYATDADISALAYLKCPRKIAQYLGTTPERVERALSRQKRRGTRIAYDVRIRPSVVNYMDNDNDPCGLNEVTERVRSYIGRRG